MCFDSTRVVGGNRISSPPSIYSSVRSVSNLSSSSSSSSSRISSASDIDFFRPSREPLSSQVDNEILGEISGSLPSSSIRRSSSALSSFSSSRESLSSQRDNRILSEISGSLPLSSIRRSSSALSMRDVGVLSYSFIKRCVIGDLHYRGRLRDILSSSVRLSLAAVPLLPLGVLAAKKCRQMGINYRSYKKEVANNVCLPMKRKFDLARHLSSHAANPDCKEMSAKELGAFKEQDRVTRNKYLLAGACSLFSFFGWGLGTAAYAAAGCIYKINRHIDSCPPSLAVPQKLGLTSQSPDSSTNSVWASSVGSSQRLDPWSFDRSFLYP